MTRKTLSRLPLVLPLLAALLAGCASQVPGFASPTPVTSQASATHDLYNIVFLIAAIVFVAVEGAIVFIVLRYRRKPTDTELPAQFHGNNLVEIIWTVIPTVIVLYLFVISYNTLTTVDAVTTSPTVKIVAEAQRFSWSFTYVDPAAPCDVTKPSTPSNCKSLISTPDGKPVVFFGTLEVPPAVDVEVHLYSPDVIHAFYVPKFLFKRDVVPGKDNVFDFHVDPADAGQTFRGQCAELCGIGHGGMTFDVHAQNSPADFQAWLQKQQADAGKATPAPSVAPSGSAAPGGPSASPSSGGATLQIAATNTAFDKSTLEAPAGQAFTITFQNNDAGTPHDVQILNADGSNAFKGDIITGPATATYQVPALAAGTYKFQCIVHPGTMNGTLTVK